LTPIDDVYARLPDPDLPARQAVDCIAFGQADAFFHLAATKEDRISKLKAFFAGKRVRKLYLCAHLSGFDCQVEGLEVGYLEASFFQETDPVRRLENQQLVHGCVVIFNSSVIRSMLPNSAFVELYEACSSTCFVAWDHDNHHWLQMSTFMAAHSDIYVPAHHENLYILSRYNWLTAGPVYASSLQWSRKFLTENLPKMLTAQRSPDPLGKHVQYIRFGFRNSVVRTLETHYPSIGFSQQTFHARTPQDRLEEWYSHKMHWIAPVLNDITIRIFDALVTGGIPIVPASLRLLPPVSAIPREHIAFCTPMDIVNPHTLVARINQRFDEMACDGMVARHRFALEHHHANTSIEHMLRIAAEVLEFERN
jgi:hypothetical protein